MKYENVIDFIQDIFNTKDSIALHAPYFKGNERKYVIDTIDSTFVSSVGEYVDKSERLFEKITGSKKAVAVVNGTSGLQVALKLAGVSEGDEVITQALTFVATANAIQYCGASPVFLDVDYETMGLSPNSISSFLEDFGEKREHATYNKKTGKKIAACVPMHTFGFPVRLDEIVNICNDWNIPLIEDAAESLGSLYKNKHTGTFGKISAFSFNGNKIVTSGGGGMIITQDQSLGKEAKHLTTTAKVPHPFEYVHDFIGFNFRLPNINAALLLGQLEQLDHFLDSKRRLALVYEAFFLGIGINFRKEMENTRANYWLMSVELENKAERDYFLEITNSHKIMTRPIWKLMHKLPMYKHCYRDCQKNAEFLEQRIVNIPSNVGQ